MASNKFKVDKEAKVHKEDKDNKIPTSARQSWTATMSSATPPDIMCTAPKNPITTKTTQSKL